MVRKSVRVNILNRHGKFDELRSDHAREFMGQVMTLLSKEYGYIHSSTGLHSAMGNATMERFWAFLGTCLRSMTDKQYAHFEEYLQEIAWAWNSTPKESLGGISPHEIYTGTKPRTVVGSAMHHEAPGTEMDVGSIRVAAAEYTRVALANANYMRERNAEHLNKGGRALKQLGVGMQVKIYAPPSQEEAKRRNRKIKHLMQWRRSLTITAKPSPAHFILSLDSDPSKTFERHITNIRRRVGDGFATPEATTAKDNDEPLTGEAPKLEIGDMAFAREDTTSSRVDLAKVVSQSEKIATLHCWGNTGNTFKTSKFVSVFVRTDGRVLLSKPKGRSRAAPWTWEISRDDEPELIAVRDVKLGRSGCLLADSLKSVVAARPALVLHRFS
jgi:hypothetical protein